jgi:hypothetical protein
MWRGAVCESTHAIWRDELKQAPSELAEPALIFGRAQTRAQLGDIRQPRDHVEVRWQVDHACPRERSVTI